MYAFLWGSEVINMNITTRQFSVYRDMDILWDFFTEIYDRLILQTGV